MAAEPGQPSREQLAALALWSIKGVGPKTLEGLRRSFGSLEAAIEAGPARLATGLSAEAEQSRAALGLTAPADIWGLGERALEAARRAGARMLFAGSPDFPARLAPIDACPAVLWLRGALPAEARRVAVVGSREGDEYGLAMARHLTEGLCAGGIEVVSGGAIGIDGAAHQAAVDRGGKTAVVLGSGVDVLYPPQHARLFEKVLEGGGALLSECPPGTGAISTNFPRRNRVISGLSEAVVVVRGGPKSGALRTARYAAEQGRPVFAVPGNAGNPLSACTNALLESGEARACTRASTVLRALRLPATGTAQLELAPLAFRPGAAVSAAVGPRAEVPPGAPGAVYALTEAAPRHFDEILRLSGLSAAALADALTELELLGLVEQRSGKMFQRA